MCKTRILNLFLSSSVKLFFKEFFAEYINDTNSGEFECVEKIENVP